MRLTKELCTVIAHACSVLTPPTSSLLLSNENGRKARPPSSRTSPSPRFFPVEISVPLAGRTCCLVRPLLVEHHDEHRPGLLQNAPAAPRNASESSGGGIMLRKLGKRREGQGVGAQDSTRYATYPYATVLLSHLSYGGILQSYHVSTESYITCQATETLKLRFTSGFSMSFRLVDRIQYTAVG